MNVSKSIGSQFLSALTGLLLRWNPVEPTVPQTSSAVIISKEHQNLFEGFIFRFGNLLVREDPKYSEQGGEGEERVVFQTGLHGLEADADDEIGQPVDENGDRHGGRPRPLWEEFGCDEPGNGTRSEGEEHDE